MGMTSIEMLLEMRAGWRQYGQRVIMTNGIFDLLHAGHVIYLEQARQLGDVLIVALNSDSSTRTIKGPRRPLMPEQARVHDVSALRCVDCVTVFEEPTAERLVAALQPDIYVKGGDYARPDPDDDTTLTIDEDRLPEAQIVRQYGGQVRLIPYWQGYSTTALLERILHLYKEEQP